MTHSPPRVATWEQINQQLPGCERCPRLRLYCQHVAVEKRAAYREWEYWGKPVPNFGDPQAQVLLVGLAPAAHGANRTGRMFTGDRSGDWLYRALHRVGLASQPHGQHPGDGLRLINCAITATCHCAPPDNQPLPAELAACRFWLQATMNAVPAQIYVALGQIAWKSLFAELKERGQWQGARPKFAHAAEQRLWDGRWALASFHPSQQNTFTGRLTEPMFNQLFDRVVELLGQPREGSA